MVGDIHVCVYVSLSVTIKFVLNFSLYIYINVFVYLFLYRIYKKNYTIISRDVERSFGHIPSFSGMPCTQLQQGLPSALNQICIITCRSRSIIYGFNMLFIKNFCIYAHEEICGFLIMHYWILLSCNTGMKIVGMKK